MLRLTLAVLGAMGGQGSALLWATNHRKHHRFADRDGDPHSPSPHGDGLGQRLRGLWHAHFGWMLSCLVSDEARYAADVRRDPITRWCSDHYALLCATSLLAPALAGIVLHRFFLFGEAPTPDLVESVIDRIILPAATAAGR